MQAIKFILPLALMLGSGAVNAADLDGEKLYNAKTCASCHGAGGNKPILDTYPKLGGQSAAYLKAKLMEYKEGKITGGQAAVMTPMAAMLSEEEIGAVSDYLAGAVECKPAE